MRFTIGHFARQGLEIEWGPDLSSAIDRALDEYLDRLESGDLEPLPPFSVTALRGGSTVSVEVDPEREIRLIEESVRRGFSIDDLAGEAIVHHLARLDLQGVALSAS